MNRMKCLIVDDERQAIKTIVSLVNDRHDLVLAASTQDAREVVALVELHRIELVFVDLHMPHIHGLDLMKQLLGRVQLICCSADLQYGQALFELGVAFYLNKPISVELFNKAVDRAWALKNSSANDPDSKVIVPMELEDSVVFNRVVGPHLRMQLIDIECIEAKEDDCLLTYTDGSDLVKLGIGKFESILPAEHFLRVHRSFIVALKNVKNVDFTKRKIWLRNSSQVDEIAIGKTYLPALRKLFGVEELKN